jgi:hypothetical protein
MERMRVAIEKLKDYGVQPFADGRYGFFLKPSQVEPLLEGVELNQLILPPRLDSTTQIVAGKYLGACDLAHVWLWKTSVSDEMLEAGKL